MIALLLAAFPHAPDKATEDAIRDVGDCVEDWCNISNDLYPELREEGPWPD